MRLKITEHNSVIEFPRCLKAVEDNAKISEDIPEYSRRIHKSSLGNTYSNCPFELLFPYIKDGAY